jgi:histidine ammonia-lyase
MIVQYVAAALVSELRALAHPVSTDSITSSDNQEDHVSMGMTAATMTLDALERLPLVLACELLCAAQAIDCSQGAAGHGSTRLHALVRRRVLPLEADRPPAGDLDVLSGLIVSAAMQTMLADVHAGI